MAAFSSKVVVPPLRARFVPRERLVRHLEDAVAGGVPLSLVCAPAGFGKTSLLAQWLRQSGRAAAWLTLDDSDDDPSVF
ncbi:MAG TPA: hypothetical protein VNT60_00350, partial [Deinococcales bacterium]|nr:hypothetical protein [Deinococcales bacterium]